MRAGAPYRVEPPFHAHGVPGVADSAGPARPPSKSGSGSPSTSQSKPVSLSELAAWDRFSTSFSTRSRSSPCTTSPSSRSSDGMLDGGISSPCPSCDPRSRRIGSQHLGPESRRKSVLLVTRPRRLRGPDDGCCRCRPRAPRQRWCCPAPPSSLRSRPRTPRLERGPAIAFLEVHPWPHPSTRRLQRPQHP
jgi:hypothetical protein